MRLSKRLAVGVLAAVLALSMTACGGSSGNGTGGNPSSKPGQTPPSSGSSSSSSSSMSTTDKKDDINTSPKEDENKMLIGTRTEKFFSGHNIINSAKWTYTDEITDTEYSNRTVMVASDDRRTYRKETQGNYDGIEITDSKEKKEYKIDETNRKVYIEDHGDIPYYGSLEYDCLYLKFDPIQSIRSGNVSCKIGTYQVDGVTYYSETYRSTVGKYWKSESKKGKLESTRIFCFDMGDTEGKNLRYYISVDVEDGVVARTVKNKITKISNTFDESLLRIPEGYRLYRDDPDTGKLVLVTESTPKDNYPN